METQQYKTQLEELLQNLTKELAAIGIHNPENPDDWVAVPEDTDMQEPDPNDAADKVEDWNERRSIVATLETRYNNIKAALDRIEKGTYGVCAVCQNHIEKDRLEANPAANTCKVHLEEVS